SLMLSYRINYNGKTITLSDAYYNSDISYEEYLEICEDYYDYLNPLVCDIYIELINVRNEMAQLEGYNSYEEYVHAYSYSDYSLEDIENYREYVKKYFADGYQQATSYAFDNIFNEFSTDQMMDIIEYTCLDSSVLT